MKSQHQPVRSISVDVAVLEALEAYLGDRPRTDKRALDLHERIVTLLAALGAL